MPSPSELLRLFWAARGPLGGRGGFRPGRTSPGSRSLPHCPAPSPQRVADLSTTARRGPAHRPARTHLNSPFAFQSIQISQGADQSQASSKGRGGHASRKCWLKSLQSEAGCGKFEFSGGPWCGRSCFRGSVGFQTERVLCSLLEVSRQTCLR